MNMPKFKIPLRQNGIFGLVGAGGFGREVMNGLEEFDLKDENYRKIRVDKSVFVDSFTDEIKVNQIEVFSEETFFEFPIFVKYFNVAIGDSGLREAIVEKFISAGVKPISIITRNSRIHDSTKIGEGAILCNSSIITANSHIGKYFHANIFSYIAHDCVVGDYVTLAPRVSCNGNVVIGDHAYIGTGAVIKPGSKNNPLYIGKSSVIGMGAVVIEDVPDFAVVVGNPARVIRYIDVDKPKIQ